MKRRKMLAIALSAAMVVTMIPGMAFADDATGSTAAPAAFVDMPDDWSTTALQNAVANGLISGYDTEAGKAIKPQGSLTRAEMATIVNKGFGASEKAALSGVNDVPAGEWYADQMARAIQMGTFAKAAEMRPNANITRQEAMAVLARAFKLDDNTSAADKFGDSGSIASWAKGSVGAMAAAGYVSGNNGNINPTSNISRAEFAKIMDGMVAKYFTTAGTFSEVPAKGNVMINVAGVTLKGATITGDLILGDGIGSGEVTLDGVKVTGKTIVRGGGANSVIVKGDSSLGTVVVAKPAGDVRIAVEGNAKVDTISVVDGSSKVAVEGKVGTLNVQSADVKVVVQKATITNVNVNVAKADVTIAKDATVSTVTIPKDAEAAKVAVSGKVDTMKNAAPKAELSVAAGGVVTKMEIAKTGDGTKVNIDKAGKVPALANDAKIENTGTGKADSVTGSGSVNNTPSKEEDKGTSGGGGGSSSSKVAVGSFTGTVKIADKEYNINNSTVKADISATWTTATALEAEVAGTGFENRSYPMYVKVKAGSQVEVAFLQDVAGKDLNKEHSITNNNVLDKLSDKNKRLVEGIISEWENMDPAEKIGKTITVKIGTKVNGSEQDILTLTLTVKGN